MSSKPFILSSAGLKNVIEDQSDFTFMFGKCEIVMNRIFAEFISPNVSHIHHSDPTIDSYQFCYPQNAIFPPIEELFTEEMVNLLKLISQGIQVSINSDQAKKMQHISILLGNSELFNSLQGLHSQQLTDNNIDASLAKLELYQYQPQNTTMFQNIDFSLLIDTISSNFYQIDQNKLKKLSTPILHAIISNEHLKIDNEDSLYEFIKEIFNEKEKEKESESELTIYDFYEGIEFVCLSDDKFKDFIESFDATRMTASVWQKLCNRFLNVKNDKRYAKQKVEPKSRQFLYDGNQSNSFHGIIHALTKECGGNVDDKGEVSVTALKVINSYPAKLTVDLDSISSGLITNCEKNSWLMYDFKNRKVRPTHYSIRSWAWSPNCHHLKDWVIEGSNTGGNDWKVLDSQNNVTCLNSISVFSTFKIKENLSSDEYYRFLRLRQTGKNFAGNDQLCLNSLEYFGSII